MKKFIISVSGIIIIILLSLILIFTTSNDDDDSKEIKSISEQILEEINQVENNLVYITNTDYKKCSLCSSADLLIDFYEDMYELKFLRFDLNQTNEDDLRNLYKALNIEYMEIVNPAVLFIQDKKVASVANEIFYEADLKNFLLQYNFISEKYFNREFEINDSNMKERYSSDTKRIVAYYVASSQGYELRKNLMKLAVQYDFQFDVIHSGYLDESIVTKSLKENYGTFKLPCLAIVQNNQLLAFEPSDEEDKLRIILKKHNFIK